MAIADVLLPVELGVQVPRIVVDPRIISSGLAQLRSKNQVPCKCDTYHHQVAWTKGEKGGGGVNVGTLKY